jgi:hypothetical protein
MGLFDKNTETEKQREADERSPSRTIIIHRL